jgi:hypothetical protein
MLLTWTKNRCSKFLSIPGFWLSFLYYVGIRKIATNMEKRQVEMWNDLGNAEENCEMIQFAFHLYFPYLFTIQLAFLPYFPYHFTIQLGFLSYFSYLSTIRLAFLPYFPYHFTFQLFYCYFNSLIKSTGTCGQDPPPFFLNIDFLFM